LSANIYFPVIPAISRDLGVSVEQINVSVVVYMVVQGVAPSFFGSICDVLGRRPVYLFTFVMCVFAFAAEAPLAVLTLIFARSYLGACAGLASCHEYWLLLVLRCVQAAGSSSTIAIGSGAIGDIAPPKDRGLFIAVFGLGCAQTSSSCTQAQRPRSPLTHSRRPMVGPCIGPVVGASPDSLFSCLVPQRSC